MTPTPNKDASKEEVCVDARTNKGMMKMVFFERVHKKLILTDAGCDYITKMASMGCSIDDIADELGVSKPTLYTPHNKDKLNKAIKKGQGRLKNSLRMAQVKTAVKGNSAMLIFLGKNYLGQSDNPKVDDAETSALSGLVEALEKYKDDRDCTDTPPQ